MLLVTQSQLSPHTTWLQDMNINMRRTLSTSKTKTDASYLQEKPPCSGRPAHPEQSPNITRASVYRLYRPNNIMKRRPVHSETIINYWTCLASCCSDADKEDRQTRRRRIKVRLWGQFTSVRDLSRQQRSCNRLRSFFRNLKYTLKV